MREGPLHQHNQQAARDRTRIIRALGKWADEMGEHTDHGNWEQVGRCVYCGCGARLYQGTLPKKPTPPDSRASEVDGG